MIICTLITFFLKQPNSDRTGILKVLSFGYGCQESYYLLIRRGHKALKITNLIVYFKFSKQSGGAERKFYICVYALLLGP